MNKNARLIFRFWLMSQRIDEPVIKFPIQDKTPSHGTVEIYPKDFLELLDEVDLINESNYRDL